MEMKPINTENRNDITGAVKMAARTLEAAYPNSRFFIVANDVHQDETGRPRKVQIATKRGDEADIESMAAQLAGETEWLANLCVDVALGIIVSIEPEQVTVRSAAELHDAALDYARDRGIDTKGIAYCRDTERWRRDPEPGVHRIGQRVEPNMLEQHITQVEAELRRLKGLRNPDTMLAYMRGEVKRLNRKGEYEAAKSLQAELDAFVEAARRREELRQRRLEWLAKGRETLRRKREGRRNQRPQPNFAKMAKAKRQQISERKAERRKRKAAAGNGTPGVKSCSQLLAR